MSDFTLPPQYNPQVGSTGVNSITTDLGAPTSMFTAGNSGPVIAYTSMTGELVRLLTANEKKDLEVPRQLYTDIKLLDKIEKLYAFEKIKENEYEAKAESLLKQIARIKLNMKQRIPNFSIDSFIQEYGLGECTWALEKLKKEENPNQGGEKIGYLIAGITARFIKISDFFLLTDSITPRDAIPLLEDMKQLLEKIKPNFHSSSNPFNLADHYATLLIQFNKIPLGDNISKELVE